MLCQKHYWYMVLIYMSCSHLGYYTLHSHYSCRTYNLIYKVIFYLLYFFLYQHHIDYDEKATCVMLAIMSSKIQIQPENMDAHTMIMHFKELIDTTSKTGKHETSRELFCCKMIRYSSMNIHVLFMIENYISTSHDSS
jgi:hypothetical protein